MTRILITGAAGQVGSALLSRWWPADYSVIPADRPGLNICAGAAVDTLLDDERPDIVINAAAYTAVDRAEDDAELAYAVNRDGSANLARACARTGAALIHLSTDYVFDGSTNRPYVESDLAAPCTIYGASKLAGEQAVRDTLERHVILRLSWVFSEHGRNFLRTILRLAAGGRRHQPPELRVVDDQHGCPTYAGHAAAAIAAIVDRLKDAPQWGVFHYCDRPDTTWFGFASAIVDAARESGTHDIKVTNIVPVATAEFPTAAKRPQHSILDCRKIVAAYGVQPQPWAGGITAALQALSRPTG